MGGGLMQVVTKGKQDAYLTGNPQITFFKSVYRRHTNFSMESIEQRYIANNNNSINTLNSIEQFRWTINKDGDLLQNLYLDMTLEVTHHVNNNNTSIWPIPNLDCDNNPINITELNNNLKVIWNPTHLLIDNISCNIGGIKIDEQSGHWLEIYSQLNEPNNTGTISNIVSRQGNQFQKLTKSGGSCHYNSNSLFTNINKKNNLKKVKFDAHVPLRFWFCKYTGLALPLVALQYHDVDIFLNINKECLTNKDYNDGAGIDIHNLSLWANYIYLDTEERRRFSLLKHEYLIDQVQHNLIKGKISKYYQPLSYLELKFNHPVKELIWTAKYDKQCGYQDNLLGSTYSLEDENFYYDNPIRYQLILNGLDRFTERKLEYFTQQQIYDYHNGYPVPTPSKFLHDYKEKNFHKLSHGWTNTTIAVYSFSLKPNEHQPTGTCNFSKIELARLNINNVESSKEINNVYREISNEYNVYAINYNILRVGNGMAGLLYSN